MMSSCRVTLDYQAIKECLEDSDQEYVIVQTIATR